jgi:hypothetical protein
VYTGNVFYLGKLFSNQFGDAFKDTDPILTLIWFLNDPRRGTRDDFDFVGPQFLGRHYGAARYRGCKFAGFHVY